MTITTVALELRSQLLMMIVICAYTILKQIVIREKRRILIIKYHLLLRLADLEAKDTGLSARGIKMACIAEKELGFSIKMVITLPAVIAMTSPIAQER